MTHGGQSICCCVWGYGILLEYMYDVYFAVWGYACMYMMTGWSSGMYDLMSVCMHVCVFSMFMLYIIIITVLQDL